MSWLAKLDVDYRVEDQRCVARHLHEGPLRILKSLYPEGDAVCHNILVHPPSGLVGGDELRIGLNLQPHAHALITPPGATRFYGSDGLTASQQVQATLADHARLEWLPLEALAYNGCQAHNQVVFKLAPHSQLIAWDITALGLPHAHQPFVQGQFQQHLEIEGVWLERGCIRADDQRLKAGVSSPNPRVVVLRVLSDQLEPAVDLLKKVWLQWRSQVWGMPAMAPRIWAM